MHGTKEKHKFANKSSKIRQFCMKIDLSVRLFCLVGTVLMSTMVTWVSSYGYYVRYHYQCYHCSYNCDVCKVTYIPTVTIVTNVTLHIKVTMVTFLFSSFRRVSIVICSSLGNSPASEF